MKCPKCASEMEVIGNPYGFNIYDSKQKRIACIRGYNCKKCGEELYRKIDW